MKRSEMMAWTGLAGLLAIGVVLLIGGVVYNTTPFWAGMMLAFAQALVVGLAGWGLSLARQRAELEDLPALQDRGGFRMSFGDEAGSAMTSRQSQEEGGEHARTLDSAFQRMVVAVAAVLLLAAGAITSYLIYSTFAWFRANPDQPFPIAGTFANPKLLDAQALLIGLASSLGYLLLYWITRPRRDGGEEEAVNGNFTLGLGAMIALGVATVLGFLKVEYAAEVGAAIMAALMALQGVELLVNSIRSYAAIEELDEEAIDLQALPLVPMLSSVWLSGLKLLFEQSVGLAQTKERGVLSRMMPRAIGAAIVIAILISCLRVVQPGMVAIRERLGYATMPGSILGPGLHLTLPWPLDQLVTIPTEQLQITDVGAELHAPKSDTRQQVDFRFWTVRPGNVSESQDNEDQFVTGDPGSPQMLETYVVVQWRVADPAKFYTGLSHSDFFEKGKGETKAVPIYEALVQECTSFAVTRTFAIHSLDDLMIFGRREAELHCKRILQAKLDEAGSGIEAVDLTIKDLHPPLGKGRRPDPARPGRLLLGPADAYENVTSMREYRETMKDRGEAVKIRATNLANGDYAAEISKADGYKADKVAAAQGEAARMQAIMEGSDSLTAAQRQAMTDFAERQAMFRSLKDVFAPVSKILVDPKVKDMSLYQNSEKGGAMPPMMPGRPPG